MDEMNDPLPPGGDGVTHGGKRTGAGQPPRPVPRKAITVRVEPEHHKRFNELCADRECSQSALITEWITRASAYGDMLERLGDPEMVAKLRGGDWSIPDA